MRIILVENRVDGGTTIMKLLLIFLAAAYAAPAPLAHHGSDAYIVHEPIGYEQPSFDRYSFGYGNSDYVGYGGLIEQPVHYNVGRQGVGFDKRTAFAYGFRMPLTNDLIKILRRYPEGEMHHVKA